MPAQTAPEDLTRAQWDALKAILVAESTAGNRLNGCSWTDAYGNPQTSSIVDVRRNVEHFFTGSLDPTKYDVRSRGVAGVQLLEWDPQVYANGRYWLVTIYQITVGAVSVTQTVSGKDLIANGDDALAQAWSFVSDGNGNGLSSILRDRKNWPLNDPNGNATCNKMSPGKGKPRLEVGAGETPQLWGFIDMIVRCEKPLAAMA